MWLLQLVSHLFFFFFFNAPLASFATLKKNRQQKKASETYFERCVEATSLYVRKHLCFIKALKQKNSGEGLKLMNC